MGQAQSLTLPTNFSDRPNRDLSQSVIKTLIQRKLSMKRTSLVLSFRKMTKLINVMIKVMKMGTGQMRMGLTITLMMTAGD